MRPLSELLNESESAWSQVQEWVSTIPGRCITLPAAVDSGDALYRVQVTTRSPMGAVLYHTGGLLVDHGWLRILGSGAPALTRSLPAWNDGRGLGFYLVADDVSGGFFALNGGTFGETMGELHYWSPDKLDWENLHMTYSQFLVWALTTDFKGFYDNVRWQGWQDEMTTVPGDSAYHFYPFLWTKEGSVARSTRAIVPIKEVYDAKLDMRKQLLHHASPTPAKKTWLGSALIAGYRAVRNVKKD